MGSLKKTLNPFVKPQGYPSDLATNCGHHVRVTTTIFGTNALSILNSGILPFSDKTSLRKFVRRVSSR